MKSTWKVLSPRGVNAVDFHSTMGNAHGRCRCTVPGGGLCGEQATCVVEFQNPLELVQRAACCEECRRRCFGSTAKERSAARKEAERRQLLAFDVAIVNHENPQPWRR